MGRYLDIATSVTQAQRDEATGDDGAVFFAVDPRQRNRRLLQDRGEPGETSESSERRSAEVPLHCLHGTTVVECALCSGYARWLIAGGDARISEARRNPDAARRAFWRAAAMGAPSV